MKTIAHLFSLILIFSIIFTYQLQAQNCISPDNGTGTATFPPEGCSFTSPDQQWMIIDGLPPGTTIEMDGHMGNFICCPVGCPLCSAPIPPGECETAGGTLGGLVSCFEATLDFEVMGTGQLQGFVRNISIPIFCEVHTGPKNPGDPVQTFPNEMFRLQGELFGDPDFCLLKVSGGTDYGLPSPGNTTLTKLPNGDFNVDSFFDITYQIEFEGCPGSALDGYMGITTATIRMETGEPYEPIIPLFAGEDPYTSPCGKFNFGENADYDPLPADFFGPGSDPFEGQIALMGEPSEGSQLPSPDVIINRLNDANLEPGTSETVPIEIVQLDLISESPIKVTYNGGMTESFFDVYVDLDIGYPSTGTNTITQIDDYGGEFIYDLAAFPQFTFVEQGTAVNYVFDPGSWGFSAINYTSENPNLWTLSPIPGEFDVVSDERIILQSPTGSWIELLPLPIRQDYFIVSIDEYGMVEYSDGSGWNNSTWYEYPNFNWINVWFYNHPYSPDRRKIIDGMMIIEPRDPSLDSYVEIVWNWTGPDWPGWPEIDNPPLPEDVQDPGTELQMIKRQEIPYTFNGNIQEPFPIEVPFNILEYNPEWLSVDIRGFNYILNGNIQHICWKEGDCSKQDIDWGDAPDPTYPTFAINDGGHHLLDGITYLGNMVDSEADGQPDPNALGDDNNGGPDEDGVIFTSPIISGQIVTLDVIASIDGFLNLWIDYDMNGSWAEAGEHVFDDLLITAGLNNLSFNVPAGTLSGISFARFRFTSDNNMIESYKGGAANGEVEDYEIFIEQEQQEEIDFGDVPDPTFPTLLANDGARHILDGVTFLGGQVDAEPDGQPDPNALGDDNNNIMDEDGVIFNWPLLTGGPVDITIITSSAGWLNAWIDYDGDGTWTQTNEHVFINHWFNSGGAHSLSTIIPPSAVPGISFARFRFSSETGLSFFGLAPDGEVEDYEILIEENPDIKWQQLPNASLPGLHSHDYIIAGAGIQAIVLADDWLCNGGLVTDIHWWGNYELDALNQEKRGAGINHFHVSIHNDDPTGLCLPTDPEQVGFNIPFSALNEQNTGMVNIEGGNIYLYEFILPQPFVQEEGIRYWVDITAVAVDPNMPPLWRWQESRRTYNPILCGAVDKTEPNISPWSTIEWLPNPPHKYSDMAFIITSVDMEDMDWGDADDPTYPTMLASDGARHIIDGITFLGSFVDPEYNGQPDPNALGDDNDGNDDEDGVTFTSQLVKNNTATIDVVASVPGILNVWLDIDRNGDWDATEQVFTNTDLNAGTNNLSFNIPNTASVGISYMRFRFSTVGNLMATGLAPDGEVEDYEVEIKEVPNKWVQYPNVNLPGLHAHDYDVLPAYGQIILADDWTCEGGWVTDIHWWGNYELDPTGNELRGAGIEYFQLSIHNLDPTGCLPQDPEIWGVDIPFSALTEISTGLINLEGCAIYLYEYILDNSFPQIEGTHYWLDITAVCTDPIDPAYWRWQESQRDLPPILCGAVEKTLPNPGTWNTITWANEANSDMAFMITSATTPEIDLGDASDPTYPTLLINNGAAHIIDYTVFLGNSIDAEPDGQPTPDAIGDDNNGSPDDEDGVIFLSSFAPGASVMIDINASTDGLINAWIDYNTNGLWTEANEQIFTDQAVVSGNNTFIINVPANANIGYTYARFRYNTAGGLSFTGLAQDGEVEDYEIHMEGELDFGDAPDQAFPSYPTLLVNDGARHIIDPDVYLGNSIDLDSDGQPDMMALGDDNDGNDDEDGVLIPAVLGHGQMTSITVIASIDGFLNGWIDFNSSGNWMEADEHIFIDQPISAGNNILNIYVPNTSVMGTSYARFRFSTSTGLSYIGQATDGEVEDYQVEIGNPEKWLQDPDLSVLGMDIDATFKLDSPDPGLILADDFQCTATGPLTRIEIWGSWLNDYYPFYEDPGAVKFTLSIHKDIPAEESTTGYSVPGDVIWYRTFDPIEFMFEPAAMNISEGWYNPALPWYIFPGDTECWKYIFPLDEEDFVQQGTMDEPIVYWLDVQAETLDPDPMCRFGWKTSIDHWNDNAVWGEGSEPYPGPWNELIYPVEHELQGQPIDMAFAIYGNENPFMLLDLTVLLEGPWDGTSMSTAINDFNLLPLHQPYSIDPLAKWYYTGTETVSAIPNTDIVDWVMIELRDAPSPGLADGNEMVDQKAAFVLKDGSIVATDGYSIIKSYATITHNPFIVIWHRNHLGVLSNTPLNLVGPGLYSYDFTAGPGQAYMDGQTNLGGTIYGMYSGDAQPNGTVNNADKLEWEGQAGTTGYKASDLNLDTHIDNVDKNDNWLPNIGKGTHVPN